MLVENRAMGRLKAPANPLLGLFLGGIVATSPALGQTNNTNITTAVTTPVATATAASGAPGNIVITSTGSVSVATGSAVTVNSNNMLTSQGSISYTGASNGNGVLVDGTGGLSNANILVSAPIAFSTTGGSGNTGLLVANGPVAGSITIDRNGSISVTGDNARGVAITSPFTGNLSLRSITVAGTGSSAVAVTGAVTGNLTLAGSVTNGGAGGYGVLVSAPISGQLLNAGSVFAGTSTTLNSTGTGTVPGLIALAGIRVSSNIGGGIVNDRYYVDTTGARVPPGSVDTAVNTLVVSAVNTTGTAPALLIAPDAANPQAITIGAAGTGADAFGVVNRGILRTISGNTGLAVTTVQIGGAGASTTLAGGLTSQANSLISASATDANATAISLQTGAVVPQIANLGAIDATTARSAASGSTPIGPGGNAVAIQIGTGASVNSISNTGTITATAVGDGRNATAVLDQSGSLASITNSGTIGAAAQNGGIARAIDLSGSNAAFVLNNSGTITGNVVLGNGATTVQLSAGTIAGGLAFGTGSNTLSLSGNAAYAGTITSGSALAVNLSGTSRLSLVDAPASIASLNASGASVLVVATRAGAPGLTVNGAASFTGTSSVSLSLQSLAQDQRVTIITATGGLTTDHTAGLVNATVSPYLFTADTPVLTANSLSINLVRRSAAEIGLSAGQAALYNQSLLSLPTGSPEAVAIANLPDQASVLAAYRQLTPAGFGHAAIRAAESFADSGFGAAQERLASVAATRDRKSGDLGVWAQEFGDFVKQKAGTEETAFRTNTLGIAGGIDKPLFGFDAVGVALLSSWSSVKQSVAPGLPDTPLQINLQGISPYVSWSRKWFFVQATALAARVTFSSTRTINIGSLSSTSAANWNGTQFGAGVTLGAKLRYGRFQIIPTNSLYWTQLHQGGYTESGGGNFDLVVESRNDTIVNNTTRLSIAYLLPFRDGNVLAEAHAAYTRQLSATNAPTVAHFLTAGDSITLPQDTEDKQRFSYGGALGYLQGSMKFVLGYDRRQNSSYNDQQAALTATMAF